MNPINRTILGEFKKITNASVSDNGKRVDLLLPSDYDETNGRITMVFPGGPIAFVMIDIRSQEIPPNVATPVITDQALLINFCHSGRCEIKTVKGECTYLTAGEIAIYAGRTANTFQYPTSEYKGFEVAVYFPKQDPHDYTMLGESFPSPEVIYDTCKDLRYPWIRKADEHIRQFYTTFNYYTEHYDGSGLILLKCVELLTVLSQLDYDRTNIRRTYYTASQVEIAKRVRNKIMTDLSIRFTARALADEFGISETSLKNYFRSVYGCGYAEYQHLARMRKSCELLEKTDLRVAEIGQAVGYSTQAKFGVAFKECHGVTPLEYRRQVRLNIVKGQKN